MAAGSEQGLETVSQLSIIDSKQSVKDNALLEERTSEVRDATVTADESNIKKNINNNNKKKNNQDKLLPSQKLVENIFPWKVLNRSARGRCAVASRNIKAGEVVVAERAVAFMPRTRYPVCHSCCCTFTEESDSVQCSSCQNVYHCKTCKERASPQHRKCCPIYKEISRIAKESDCDQDLMHFVVSLISKKYSYDGKVVDKAEQIHVKGTVEHGVINSSFQDALGLQTHQDKMPKAWRNSVRKACQAMQLVIMNEMEGTLDCSVEACQ